MTAATQDRNTQRRNADQFSFPVKANTVIFAGTLVALNAGKAIPSDGLVAHQVVGVADDAADNTGGADGAVSVPVRRRAAFRFSNSSSGDAISLANVGAPCYAVDDSTVALTSNSGARPVAGTISDVDSQGVWVFFA